MNKQFVASFIIALLFSSCSGDLCNEQKQGTTLVIPCYFCHFSDCPIIDVEIEGIRHPFELDLGCNSGDIVIRKEILEKLQCKTLKGETNAFDVQGNSYQFLKYTIPSIDIHGLKIKDAIVHQECIGFLKNTTLFDKISEDTSSTDVAGRIGTQIFESYICFFDFSKPSPLIYLTDTIHALQRHCSLKNYIEAPLETKNGLAVLSFETDLGIRRFLLDTGANACVFKESLVDKESMIKKNMAKQALDGKWLYRSRKMILGKTNFGLQKFVLLEFKKPFDNIDGILGIDFFREHLVCLDFPNGKAYIQPPQRTLWDRILSWLSGK